ncbi:MAG TPA: PAS domain-containing protein, partial [Candidatus Binatia bacterium]|nr:PAS domain-containing protein [Candidatus Binatia bacterium]
MIDLIPDPALVIDSSGKIVAANKMIGEFTGYKREQLIGRSFSSLGLISEKCKLLLKKNAKGRLEFSNITPYEINVTT